MRRSRTGPRADSLKTTAPKSRSPMSRRLLRVRNVLKSWALLFGLSAVLGIVPLLTGNYRLPLIFLFFALLLSGAGYFFLHSIPPLMCGGPQFPAGHVATL